MSVSDIGLQLVLDVSAWSLCLVSFQAKYMASNLGFVLQAY